MCYFYIILSYINFTLRYIGYETYIYKTHMHVSAILYVLNVELMLDNVT